MATGNRTLKLSILADVDDLKKKLGEADKAVEDNSNRIADFGKKAALAFAAVGAAAGAFAISAIKAAAEDETSRKKLEQTIRSNTRATEEQIAAIDDYITRQSILTATTDDELRPALSRLLRSTKDITEAQDLLSLAQNISVATGKPLLDISNALGRAFDGNTTALGKLGIKVKETVVVNKDNTAAVDALERAQLNYDLTLQKFGATAEQTQKAALALSQAQDKVGQSSTTTKTAVKDFDSIVKELQTTFGGFVDNEATNAEFKVRQLTIAFTETKEQIGLALLPTFIKLADFLLLQGVPAIQAFAAGLTGDNSLSAGFTDAQKSAESFGKTIASIAGIISGFITFVREAIGLVVSLANEMIRVANIIPGVNIGSIANPAPSAMSNQSLTTVPRIPSTPFQYNQGNPMATTVNNITVKAVDSEGAARSVAKVLNQSASRSVPQLYNSGIKGG
jgi:hypothetical protein